MGCSLVIPGEWMVGWLGKPPCIGTGIPSKFWTLWRFGFIGRKGGCLCCTVYRSFPLKHRMYHAMLYIYICVCVCAWLKFIGFIAFIDEI